ncbi:recombinase family protein [Sarcina ventriculi]|uniref:recombinase family protein n=1 Tax=Sarcina ventriculi TaxID=1267 RepID=UPI001C0F8FF8|nr:recombinase family protein [Sarcina ventriculi]MBU5323574.1 recombinase family protein [Sarcina ventriculi]
MGNYYSYMRISTKKNNDKQSFNRQEKSLKTYTKDNNIEYLLSFKDDTTGGTFNRPSWSKLEKILQKGDTIIFKEISRFTRQAEEGHKKYMELMEKGINLVFLYNPTVSTDYIKNLTSIANTQNLVTKTALDSTIKLLLIMELDRVEQERELIVKRIKQGIEASNKKSSGKQGKLDKMSEVSQSNIMFLNLDFSLKELLSSHTHKN